MENKIFVVIKDNYVINRIVVAEADAATYTYPLPHDLLLEDVDLNLYIGDWYEEAEGIFYRPIGNPEDWPDELKPPQQEQDE